MKRLSMAALGSAFIVGTVGSVPASAVTLSFQGNLQSDGTPFQGSVTADDDFLRTFAENNFRGDGVEIRGDSHRASDPSGSVSLTVGSNTYSVEGLDAYPYVALNGPLAISRGFGTSLPGFFLYVTLPASCVNEDFTTCTGSLLINSGMPEALNFPLIPTNTEPVPEPTSAIGELALGVTVAFMLVRKRKISSSRSA